MVPAVQLKGLDTYGPPVGAETVEGVWVQPVLEPPSAAVALLAGPEPESATALASRRLPATAPR